MKNKVTFFVITVSVIFSCRKSDIDINPPLYPTNLKASTKSTTQIDLSWTDNSTNEDGFKIERKTSTEVYKEIATINKDITTYSDQGLTKATAYTYRVYAYNNGGKSVTYTNEATATTQDDVPTAASNLTAEAVAFNKVNLAWTDNATNETGYKIERKTASGAFTELISLAANTVQYKDESVSENVEYTYRVFPIKSSVNGAYSNEAKTKTPFDLVTGLVAYYPFTGNAGDSSGNGNHGTVNGGITLTTDRFGILNKAYQFPGNSSSYIECGNANNLKLTQEITLAAWIYMDGGYYNPRILSYEGSYHTGYGMAVAGNSNNSRTLDALFVKGNGYGMGFCCGDGGSGIKVPALSWQFIVFTGDSKGVGKIYLNGELKNTMTGVIVNESNYINSLNIGRLSQAAYDAWGGKIDDVRIYSRALTPEQITYLATH